MSVCAPRARAGQHSERGGSGGSRAAASSLGQARRRRRRPGPGLGQRRPRRAWSWQARAEAGRACWPRARGSPPSGARAPGRGRANFSFSFALARGKVPSADSAAGTRSGPARRDPGLREEGARGRAGWRAPALSRAEVRGARWAACGPAGGRGHAPLGRRGGGGGREAERSPAAPARLPVRKNGRGRCGLGGPLGIRLPPGTVGSEVGGRPRGWCRGSRAFARSPARRPPPAREWRARSGLAERSSPLSSGAFCGGRTDSSALRGRGKLDAA